jgi:hypothetical protein
MRKISINILILIFLSSCDNSRWETIRGNGINDEPKSIHNVIYFENENHGIVGGFTLTKENKAKNINGFVSVPTLFLTEDGGKNWKAIEFNSKLRTSVDHAYLKGDTLICQLDSIVLLSTDKGEKFKIINNSEEKNKIIDYLFKANRYDIKDHDFLFKNKKYYIKEHYQNDYAIVIVCYGEKTLTDYYFASFDKGNTWIFLQESFGDNKARYLYEDKFLYCYDFPFGLHRLKLK